MKNKPTPENHLVIFEEKLEFKDLTDRERQAYKRGEADGINTAFFKIENIMLMLVILFFGMLIQHSFNIIK